MRWLESNDLGLVLIALIGLIGSIFTGSKVRDVTGKKSATEPPKEFAEVKGAIVDARDVDRMVKHLEATTAAITLHTATIEKDTAAKEALTRALERHGRCLADNTDACEDMGRSIDRVDGHVGKLANELEIARAIGERAIK